MRKLILILFFIFPQMSWGLESLSIGSFIDLAEKNDPAFKKIIKDKEKLNFVVPAGLLRPPFYFNLENEYGIDADEDEDTRLIVGSIGKEIIDTGTSFNLSYSRVTRPDREERVTEFRVEQSLYRNLFGREVRIRKKALKAEEEILRLEILSNYEDYLNQILFSYLEYRRTYLNYHLAIKFYDQINKLHTFISDKQSAGILYQTDLDKSRLEVILRKEDILDKKLALEVATNKMKAIIGTKVKNLIPISEDFSLLFTQNTFVKINDLDNLRSVQIAKLKTEISHQELKSLKRENDPDFSLVGGYNRDHSTRFSSDVKRNEFVAGFSLEIPFFDQANRANQKIEEVNLVKAKFDQEIILKEERITIESLFSQLKVIKEKQQLSSQKIALSQSIFSAETKRYQNGRIELDQLIQIQNALIDYQYQHQAIELDYFTLYLNWLNASDQLVSLRGSSL